MAGARVIRVSSIAYCHINCDRLRLWTARADSHVTLGICMSALLKPQEQYSLFEPELYHGLKLNAYFAVLTAKPESSYKTQRSYPVEYLHEVLTSLLTHGTHRDVWISQAEFYVPTRRLVHLAKLGLMFTDLDTYKVGIACSAEKQTELLLRYCEQNGLPEPSLVVFSGRGLQAKWLLETALPQRALPRWNALQDAINAKLQAFGADTRALDASRVLRLERTINSKSGEVVRVTHKNPTAYCFDKLAKSLLPFGRDVDPIHDQLQLSVDDGGNVVLLRPGEGEVPSRKWVEHSEAKNTLGLRQFMGFQLAWDRLADLRTLAQIRLGKDGQVPDGQRDMFVFLAAVFLAQATLDQNRFYDELRVLAKEFVPCWTNAHVQASASAALARMRAHIAGERVTFNGFEVSPRYRFRNETLVSERWLAVTPDEERQLLTIMSDAESKRRDAERAAQKRAEAGGMNRAAYLESHEQKRATARLMRAQGATWEKVANELGYKSAASARIACK